MLFLISALAFCALPIVFALGKAERWVRIIKIFATFLIGAATLCGIGYMYSRLIPPNQPNDFGEGLSTVLIVLFIVSAVSAVIGALRAENDGQLFNPPDGPSGRR